MYSSVVGKVAFTHAVIYCALRSVSCHTKSIASRVFDVYLPTDRFFSVRSITFFTSLTMNTLDVRQTRNIRSGEWYNSYYSKSSHSLPSLPEGNLRQGSKNRAKSTAHKHKAIDSFNHCIFFHNSPLNIFLVKAQIYIHIIKQ